MKLWPLWEFPGFADAYVRLHTPGVDSSLALDGSPTGRRFGANLIGLCPDRGCERVGGTSLHRYTLDVCSS